MTFPRDRCDFPKLVRGSDAVLSKPGYGIVAECYANRTPMLYVPRDDFRECDLLVDWMKENMVSEELPWENFLSGLWGDAIQRLFSNKGYWPSLPTNGADVAATRILETLGVQR